MKKLLLFFSFITISVCAFAQDQPILNLPVPHYRILKPDSTYTTQAALDRHKPIMFIYFAPDCPHCQRLMTEMKPYMNELKSVQIVMICATRTTYPYLNLLKNFSRDYDLPKYKNITIGSEFPRIDVATYFQAQSTPFIAIYNKTGKMIKYFDKPAKIEDIIAAVKKV